ncbi:DUF3440 domain-containing protein [Xenorhabdus japonica]|uniref:Predicted phosphoadenosine phosphosulfate sulfurtransferase, contains C-terminal DUF3440 domain n=1 Tax=Xenorhabdus japonica TaxID=53341 RepID=A0A1I5ECE2_9GAMM|nr:DUF3440 domain-containing protein [Xenorhabdus japonica]SFO08946.1 Predicted phosphoadenosine phosphosulfate sulfurtransferase, contains C-terminal DUF3440 domain [Xenorhabdus japonica]
MKKLNCNVYQAAMARLEYIFSEFDNIYISFSGGKDSGVLLNLALNYARENKLSHKLGVFHIDYEAQYNATTEYVDKTYAELDGEVENLRCCVPVKSPTCTSMFETYWRPWDADKRELWVRELPEQYLGWDDFDFLNQDTTDYQFQEQFSLWYHKKKGAKKTCVLVGIRSDESLDRWRTIISDKNINKYKNKAWTTKVADNIYNAYPIYDWCTEDIWIANAKFGWDYNRLYDLFYYAGLPIHAMRVASPFHNAAKASLGLYRAIDPDMWGKMISRVNGVNFTAIYGGTTVMGWRNITKPSHFNWEQYAKFLLNTLPEDIAENYRKKLATSIKFWREKGGVLSRDAINDLNTAGIKFDIGEKTNYKTEKSPVRMEYADDIDSKEFQLIPTWKRLCVCILKNDHVGKYMGFSQTKAEMLKRKSAIEKYKDL